MVHWIAEHVLDAPWLSANRTAPAMRPTMRDDDFELVSPSKVAAPPVGDAEGDLDVARDAHQSDVDPGAR